MKTSTFVTPLQAPHQVTGMRPALVVNDLDWKTILEDEAGSFVTLKISHFGGMHARIGYLRPEQASKQSEGRITTFYKSTLEELLSVLSEHISNELFSELVSDLDMLGLEAARAWRDNWLVGKFGLEDLNLDELKLQLQSDAHR